MGRAISGMPGQRIERLDMASRIARFHRRWAILDELKALTDHVVLHRQMLVEATPVHSRRMRRPVSGLKDGPVFIALSWRSRQAIQISRSVTSAPSLA